MKRVLFFALVGLFGWQAAAAPGPGCDTTRPAAAFYSDGSPAIAAGAPVPCGVKTGFGGAESRVATTPNGDVLQTPAIAGAGLFGTPLPAPPGTPTYEFVFTQNSGIGWTRDLGGSWELFFANGDRCPQGDNDLYVDHVTGRLYYSCIFGPLPPPANRYAVPYLADAAVMSSPGAPYTQWSRNTMYGWLSENPRFTSGPAPAGQPNPVPGENMAYWCANFTNLLVAGTRTCHRSFDGGASWQFAGIVYPSHPTECGTSAPEGGGYPQAGPDGSLWVLITCGTNRWLARSTDEAATWPLVRNGLGIPVTVPATGQLRVDSAGNLYLVSASGTSLLLRTSTDGGQSWRGPFNMTAPAVRSGTVNRSGVAIGWQPGVVAVDYLTNRSTGGFDGYISVTHNALDANPVFYAQAINPPYKPIVTASSLSDDFITLDVAPDGTPWAGFYSNCEKNNRGDYIDFYCQYTQGTRVLPFAPPIAPDTVKMMTMGTLQFP